MRTLTVDEKARRIFYSMADPEQIVRGYARIHNNARRELKRSRVNGQGRRLLELTAFGASWKRGRNDDSSDPELPKAGVKA